VEVSLVWGPNAEDRETITTNNLTAAYAKVPFKFTPKVGSIEGRLKDLLFCNWGELQFPLASC
jgi:hypothetical protein